MALARVSICAGGSVCCDCSRLFVDKFLKHDILKSPSLTYCRDGGRGGDETSLQNHSPPRQFLDTPPEHIRKFLEASSGEHFRAMFATHPQRSTKLLPFRC